MTDKEKDGIINELSKIRIDMTRVRSILENDDSISQIGLVEKVNNMDRRLTDLEIEKKILYAKSTSYGAIGAFLVGIVMLVIKFIFTYFFK